MTYCDAFLSCAPEDATWGERLAKMLRQDGIRVWFQKRAIEPGEHKLLKLNEALRRSRKMIAVWSPHYFRESNPWMLAAMYAKQHDDVLARERLLIPVMIADCDPPALFRNLAFVDFRHAEDYHLALRELIRALDLRRDSVKNANPSPLPPASPARTHQVDRPSKFYDELMILYKILGFEVSEWDGAARTRFDITQTLVGIQLRAVVDCRDKRLSADERNEIVALWVKYQQRYRDGRWIVVSIDGFSDGSRSELEKSGIDCVSYDELIQEWVPLGVYVNSLVTQLDDWTHKYWGGRDLFVRPNLHLERDRERVTAAKHIGSWLGDPERNLLVVLGDLGCGKTTLLKFVAYHLARAYQADPLRNPAPLLIPLKDMRHQHTLEDVIVSHFAARGLQGVDFTRFRQLTEIGKVVFLFDAFDEMSDRVRWEETRNKLRELCRAAEGSGRVMLTCRTHYFKDHDEQSAVIGRDPDLSTAETELYRELRQRSGAEVVYLDEFDDEQIIDYLKRARGDQADRDWKKINEIYNLKDLAHRPLMLDMIVRSLPKLDDKERINAGSLYRIYTEHWIRREDETRGGLFGDTRLALMCELARQMWHEEKDAIHYSALLPFVKGLASRSDFGDNTADAIVQLISSFQVLLY
jgi:hypothetical protein